MDFIFHWGLTDDKEVKVALMGEGTILYQVPLRKLCLNGELNEECEFYGYLWKEEMAMSGIFQKLLETSVDTVRGEECDRK